MTSAIYDFEDIRSRMLGEDKPQPKPPEPKVEDEVRLILPSPFWRLFNSGDPTS